MGPRIHFVACGGAEKRGGDGHDKFLSVALRSNLDRKHWSYAMLRALYVNKALSPLCARAFGVQA